MKVLLEGAIYIVLGGASFWLPDIALHAKRGQLFFAPDVLVLTLLLPTTFMACFGVLRWLTSKRASGPSVSLFMLTGVWLLGPLSMTAAATFSGGGFHEVGDWSSVSWLIVFSIVPVYTFIMSAYDGTLIAVSLITIAMVFSHFRWEKNYWIIPPALRRRNEKQS